MLKLIHFFQKNKTGILFVVLELIALFFIIRTHSYHYSKYLDSANYISGNLLKTSDNLTDYLSLKEQNKLLVKENTLLNNQLQKLKVFSTESKKNTLDSIQKFVYINARVINAPYQFRNNILTLDKGSEDGINPDMGVITHNGIIGITLNVSKHFSTVLSLLHSQSKVNVMLKRNKHFGTLVWEGSDYRIAAIRDLPIQASISIGDTVITGGKSIFFPKGIPIGTIRDFKESDKTYTAVNVHLFTDFSALHHVYIINNMLYAEQKKLEAKSSDE